MSAQLMIRPVHPNDAADLYAVVSHPAVAVNLVQLPSMELSQTQSWVQEPKPGQHRLVAEVNGGPEAASGRAIGSINITQMQNPRLAHMGKIGIMVHPEFWRQGVGNALMTAVLNLADNWLNLLRVELEVYTHHNAAIHLYEKHGFEVEGTKRKAVFGDGRYFDCLVMARLRHADWYAGQTITSPPIRRFKKPEPNQIVIRPPRYPDDLNDVYQTFRLPEVGRTTLQMPSQEIGKTRDRLKEAAAGIYRYVAEVDGRVVGMASLHQNQNPRERHTASLGMMVHPDYWSVGIGSQLLEALTKLADNWLQLTRLELEVNTDNAAGVRLYHKFGFEIEGTHKLHAYGDGRMADSYFMGRIR